LRYSTILNHTLAVKLALAALAKGVVLILPMPLLLQRLTFCRTGIPHTYCDHMAVVKMACSHTKPNRVYGVFVFLMVLGLDLLLIGVSYVLILHAVLRLSSRDATLKTLNTCSAHFFVILISYVPALFSFLAHRIGPIIPPHVHILLANLYLLMPSLFNPIIYGIKTKEIRDKMAKCLCRRDTLAIYPGQKDGSGQMGRILTSNPNFHLQELKLVPGNWSLAKDCQHDGLGDVLSPVNITMDPTTASPYIIIYEDLKSVTPRDDCPDQPKSTAKSHFCDVIGQQAFSSGILSEEVDVSKQSQWALGISIEDPRDDHEQALG
ncbi:putative olfactory receptor 52P1, partial [Vombatus ursinus]|uniref:putative olfactory receptor 52P1 n=1 Tax=Vombatus ursinus TaxID=29139 RepID=UPI000FFD53DC